MGALAMTSGDPDVPVEPGVTGRTGAVGVVGVAGAAVDPAPLGVCVSTGALALANVPVRDELEPVPFPVVSTGALALTAGEPDVPVEPDAPAEPEVTGRTGAVGAVVTGRTGAVGAVVTGSTGAVGVLGVTGSTGAVGVVGVAGAAVDPAPLGVCVSTGALALANVPVRDELFPESVPFPVVSTGALALTAGDPDVPVEPVVAGRTGAVEPEVTGRTGAIGALGVAGRTGAAWLVRLGKDTGAMA